MALYKDLLSRDEVLNSYFDTEEVDDAVYKAEGRWVNKSNADNFDIGANPSAEGGDEEGVDEAGVERVIDIVDNFRLSKAEGLYPKKTDFAAGIKGYLAKLSAKLKEMGKDDDEVKKVQAGIKEFCKKIVKDFGSWDFYTGESQDPEAMIVMCQWAPGKSGEEAPIFYVWKYGVSSEKI